MGLKCSRALCGSLVALFASMAAPAGAATFTYNLTGDPANVIDYHGLGGWVDKTLSLTDADSSSGQLPGGFTVSVGDTINVDLTLARDFTVPASQYGPSLAIVLQGIGSYGIETLTAATFYRDGVPVTTPFPASSDVESIPNIGLASDAPSATPTASFSFDQIVFSGQVDRIWDQTVQPVSSVPVTAYQPYLSVFVNPVPLPAAGWLLLSGIGGLLAVRGRKK